MDESEFVVTCPLRLSIAGGGTDLPFYAKSNGAHLLSVALGRGLSVRIRPRRSSGARSRIQASELTGRELDDARQMVHAVTNYAMASWGLSSNYCIDVVVDTPAPPGSGLGGSSAFMVGLTVGLRYFTGQTTSSVDVARDAVRIERCVLRRYGGFQDQYVSAVGGFLEMRAYGLDNVEVAMLKVPEVSVRKLLSSLTVVHCGDTRDSADLLRKQIEGTQEERTFKVAIYDQLKGMVPMARTALLKGDLELLGTVFRRHSEVKMGLGRAIVTERAGHFLQLAESYGTLGAKLIGAGGGGCVAAIFPSSLQRERFLAAAASDGGISISFHSIGGTPQVSGALGAEGSVGREREIDR